MKIDYSQNKLHTYLECPRKFELRFLLQQIWPAVQSEPVLEMEEHIYNGKRFHLLAQQFFSGIGPEIIIKQADNEIMERWWNSFLPFANQFISWNHQPEVLISATIGDKRFVGIYDLLLYSPGEKFIIIDWKTNHRKPDKSILEQHIQTRLYSTLLTLSGDQWNNNQKISPEQIEMIYWFANDPENPESFLYSEHQFQSDIEFINNLVSRIENTRQGEFKLTDNEKLCKFCNYRSLCDRGTKAGLVNEIDSIDFEFLYEEIKDIDIAQVGEIAF